jgi:hypothetical protein
VCDPRRVIAPVIVFQKVLRQEHEQAVDARDEEYDFREFHLLSNHLTGVESAVATGL